MTTSLVERNLLLGGLIRKLELVEADCLERALGQASGDSSVSLGDILVQSGAISPRDREFLEALLDRRLKRDDVDLAKGLDASGELSVAADLALLASGGSGNDSLGATTPASSGADPELTETRSIGEATSRGDRFRILRPHAQGGLGQVSVALDAELHREVALKEIRPKYVNDANARGRFLVEAEITGGLQHPGIVPVYGLGRDAQGRPFYAMRLIRGESLKDAIEKFHHRASASPPGERELELRRLLGRMIDVCNAIEYAHSRGVLHRDLKPSNIMLGKYGETLVVDWGLAKVMEDSPLPAGLDIEPHLRPSSGDDSSRTQMGSMVGTPQYMSPEQAEGRLDLLAPTTDVYSLGATLYCLLTGRPSVDAQTTAEVMSRVRAGHVRRPREIHRWIAPSLEAICVKAMQVSTHDRYASARALADDLERWLADEPVVARREPWLDRVRRWGRRHRQLVTAAAVLLITAAIAMAVGNVLIRGERDIARGERDRANQESQRANEQRTRAEAATLHARQSAQSTREVVEQFLIKVGDDRWAEIPQFGEVRAEMVKLAVDRYRQLLQQSPDDAALRSDAAMAFRRCANLHRMLGDYDAATALYDEAEDLLRAAIGQQPGQIQFHTRLIDLLCDAADKTARQQGVAAAAPRFRQALDEAQAFVVEFPDTPDAMKLTARTQLEYSHILHQQGNLAESLPMAKRARRIYGDLASEQPADPTARLLANFARNNLGVIQLEADQLDAAQATLEEAMRQGRDLLRLSPSHPDLRAVLATSVLELSRVRKAQERTVDRDVLLEEAVGMFASLVEDFAAADVMPRRLADALTDRAQARLDAGQWPTALEDCDRAVALLAELHDSSNGAAIYAWYLAKAHSVRARVVDALGESAAPDRQKATEFYEAAMRANPSDPRLRDLKRQLDDQPAPR